jgi:hypothetical protein
LTVCKVCLKPMSNPEILANRPIGNTILSEIIQG